MNDDFVLCGSKQIAAVIKRNDRVVLEMIKNGEIAAWKYSDKPNAKYYALREDLEQWLRDQRDKYCKK